MTASRWLNRDYRNLVAAVVGVAASGLMASAGLAQETVYGSRPSAPYRVWYGADTRHSEMTISTGGRTDHREMEQAGISELNWVYGTQIGWEAGPQYWIDRMKVENRTVEPNDTFPYTYIVPGVALDEWIGAKYPDTFDWIKEGVQAGRAANPEIFVAIWANGWNEQQMYDLGLNNSVDLFMTQGYTKAPRPGLTGSWMAGIREVEELYQRGLIHKTVFGFGHMTDVPHFDDGSVWTEEELREKMEFLKTEYPEMPGVAYFPGAEGDPEKYKAMIDLVNRLSAEYWPDNWLPDGVYAMTPQISTRQRLGVTDQGAESSAPIQSKTSVYPDDMTAQQWRLTEISEGVYRIQPASDSDVSLAAQGENGAEAQVALAENSDSDAQKWKLTPVDFGFLLSPLSAPEQYLRLPSEEEGTQLTLSAKTDDRSQVFALTPEIASTDPLPAQYQAEDAQHTGGIEIRRVDDRTMGPFADLPASDAELRFENVEGFDGGEHELIFRHALDGEEGTTAELIINGETTQITLPGTGGADEWRRLRITRELKPGKTNTIVLRPTGEDAGNIDKLSIEP